MMARASTSSPNSSIRMQIPRRPARPRSRRRERETCRARKPRRFADIECPPVSEELVPVDRFSLGDAHHHRLVITRRTQPVDAGNAGDDDHIFPADQCARGSKTKAVEVLVDLGVLLDVDVALRDIGFRLVIVVIANEIVDTVPGEEAREIPCRVEPPGFCCATAPASACRVGR